MYVLQISTDDLVRSFVVGFIAFGRGGRTLSKMFMHRVHAVCCIDESVSPMVERKYSCVMLVVTNPMNVTMPRIV